MTWKEKWVLAILSGYWNFGFNNAHVRIMASACILESRSVTDAIFSLQTKFDSTGDDFYLWAALNRRPSDIEVY
jgi:hypothetical protein